MEPFPLVLVIDDDPLVNLLVKRCLQAEARVRQEFAVPEEGVLDLDGVDLIFLDYQLPVRNGLAILEEFRATRPDIPVVFLTGFGDADLAQKALNGGAALFLTKPVGPSVIQESFRRFTGKQNSNGNGYSESVLNLNENGREGRSSEIVRDIDEGREITDRRFTAKLSGGREIAGKVSRFGYCSAYVEFSNSVEIPEGETLTDIQFHFGDQQLASGEAKAGLVVQSSPKTREIEISIRSGWEVDVQPPGSGERGVVTKVSSEKESLPIEDLQNEWSLLSADYRLAVHDLADVLNSVYNKATSYSNTATDPDPTVESMREDSKFVARTAAVYGGIFWDAVERFEKAAIEISDTDLQTFAKEFARRILFPYTLSSPFLSRVVERPIGVPGDYGMLGQILGNPHEGYTVYDRIVNSWILSCGAAKAYRYRVSLLHREIVSTVERCAKDGRKAKILSMASGVAYEIQRFIQEPVLGEGVDFTMVDFSTVTLKEAKRQYATLGAYPDGVTVRMEQSSVIDLANQSRGIGGEAGVDGYKPDTTYDLVYCTGLFDYLSDRLIKKVISYLFTLLRPGGSLVISNFTVENPIRSWMTYVMDWNLIYRSEADFESLVREAASDATILMETDEDGVEVYAVVKS